MLLKSATDTNNCAYPYLFTKNARTAWYNILESIKVGKSRKLKLLLPAYIGINEKEGSGVFDAVLKNQADFAFYKVTENLQVDIEDFNKKIKNESFDLALVIHYFGFSRINMDNLKSTCAENSVILVEDCAHAFYLGDSISKVGTYGDYSFYSLHKYLAVSTGGLLKTNNGTLPTPVLCSEDIIDFHALERFSSSDFKKIAEIRRSNYKFYQKKIVSNENIEVLFEISANDIPQTFPIRVKNGLREKLYFYLLDNNVPTVALYYRMIPQIDPSEFELSMLISSEILNLPVHQDTTLEDVDFVCRKINDFFGELNA
ncbi:DegT/DnrJ/EryC1/StrS family aminotransferase [Shewanella xiamenensis]|uniref:DegT/DnrJ/EryC1/StrS family aminotransferase n=1 Tax=Shewanella xiamenensis TaxID=332186 RepID=UPI00255AD115|nr:DegT/DnrJ/EryC1/StrS family aminotransferase [Shewanella xiamenensis]MDL3983937.1 DegT/DnrJ/EryC1/StrS family aminotransferase [Shewanella xiamenensis]